ncbi:MAG: hypothetical protein R3C05_04095 [Pirellulaceae bacterium]
MQQGSQQTGLQQRQLVWLGCDQAGLASCSEQVRSKSVAGSKLVVVLGSKLVAGWAANWLWCWAALNRLRCWAAAGSQHDLALRQPSERLRGCGGG